MKTSSIFAALAAVCASFAWADMPRDVAPEVAERHNLCFVDFQKLFDETLVKENARPGYWYWDGAHPTYAAHIRMADYWIEKVSEHHRRAGALK